MVPLYFFQINANKLRLNVQSYLTLICARIGAKEVNISKTRQSGSLFGHTRAI